MPLPTPKGALRAEQAVIFPPGSKVAAIKAINFTITPGTFVGLIGASASGKSTLARAILGIWPVANGAIRLDGADVAQFDRSLCGSHLGYLPQDIELFDGTIAENIARFGEVDANYVVDAALAAGVHEMILRLPQGYDTEIGGSGGALSAGQDNVSVWLVRCMAIQFWLCWTNLIPISMSRVNRLWHRLY